MFPPETLEKKKRRLIAYEENFINDDAKVELFEKWFKDKLFDVDVDIYRGWLVFKFAAAGTPKEALSHVLESKVPKQIPKTKTKRKINKPDGIQRHDPLSEEWMSIFRKKEMERAAKVAKADKTKLPVNKTVKKKRGH